MLTGRSTNCLGGINYKFDLVMKVNGVKLACKPGRMGAGDRCHVEVHDVPWKNKTEINWDQTTCSRKNQQPEQGKHTMQSGALSLFEIVETL